MVVNQPLLSRAVCHSSYQSSSRSRALSNVSRRFVAASRENITGHSLQSIMRSQTACGWV